MTKQQKTIKISPTLRDIKKEKELQEKLMSLAIQYSDVPMLFMQNLKIEGRIEISPDTYFLFLRNQFFEC